MGDSPSAIRQQREKCFQESQYNAILWMWGEGFSNEQIHGFVWTEAAYSVKKKEITRFITALTSNNQDLKPPYRHWRVTGVPSKALGMMLKDGKTIVCPSCNSRLTHIPCRGCACREEKERERKKRRAAGDGLGAAMAWMAGT